MCGAKFYDQEWVDNGKIIKTGKKPEDYTTSLMGNQSLEWLKSMENDTTPFFAWIGVHAPHLPATPAAWY